MRHVMVVDLVFVVLSHHAIFSSHLILHDNLLVTVGAYVRHQNYFALKERWDVVDIGRWVTVLFIIDHKHDGCLSR